METAAQAGNGLLGGAFLVFGVLFAAVGWLHSASSRSRVPDDGHVTDLWRRTGLRRLDAQPETLVRAAARLRTNAGVHGHELLGLPGPAGIRLAATTEHDGRRIDVGDVWDVTSVSSIGDRTVDATVRLRAVAATTVDGTHGRVVAGPTRMLDDLRDAVGLRDIQLESWDFNEAFAVRTDDRQLAIAVLTPQVLGALLDAEFLALEVAGDLVTVHEVTGSGHRSGGQAVLGERFLSAVAAVADGLRPHTWPTAEVVPDEPRARGALAFDDRPPGATHTSGDPAEGRKVRYVLTAAGLTFAVIGAVVLAIG